MTTTTTFGLVLPNFGSIGHPDTLASLSASAERAGWGGIFLWDTIQMAGTEGAPTFDPWLSLTVMATHTDTLKLGTMVSPLPRRRPWQLAKELATLDVISNGRLILGVGSGDPQDRAFSAFDEAATIHERAGILDEALELITQLWSGETIQHDGRHFTINDIAMHPRPVQQPRIPIWVGWKWPAKRPLDRAARWDGAVPFTTDEEDNYAFMSASDVGNLRDEIASRRPGTGPFDIVVYADLFSVTETSEEMMTIRDLTAAGATWLLQFVDPGSSIDDLLRAIEAGPPRLEVATAGFA